MHAIYTSIPCRLYQQSMHVTCVYHACHMNKIKQTMCPICMQFNNPSITYIVLMLQRRIYNMNIVHLLDPFQ